MIRNTIETAAIQEGWNPTTTAGVLTDLIENLVSTGVVNEGTISAYLETRCTLDETPTITIGAIPQTRVLISNIDWDDDGEDADLPKEVVFLLSPGDEDDIDYADELSDEYGFCVSSFSEGDREPIS